MSQLLSANLVIGVAVRAGLGSLVRDSVLSIKCPATAMVSP